MRKTTYLKTTLIAIAMVLTSLSAIGQEISIYSTDFESASGFAALTTYNNVTPAIFGSGSQTWSVVMGCVSATSPLTGTQSMQMRSYASNTTLGSLTMNFDLPYVTKVTFNAMSVLPVTSLNAYYSTDYGVTWSSATAISIATTKTAYTFNISATGAYKAVRIKIEQPTNNVASGRLYIDDVNIYGMTPTTPIAATPSISVASGKYISQQNVIISSATNGASIYYTTDGTIPTNASTLYTTQIAVNSSQTIKAIAYATGDDPSLLSITTYTFPTNVSGISGLKTADVNGFYKLTSEAILTYQAPATYAKPKFVQDANAGIMIYDSNAKITTTYNQYDGITGLIGTLSLYNGMLEFVPVSDPGAATSTGNTVIPQVVTLATLANYPSQLVKINNVSITGSGNFAATTVYTINDGTAGKLRTAYVLADLPYIGTAIPQVNQNITGISYNYSTTETDIVPRTSADMVNTTVTAVNQVSTNSGIYASKGNVVFSAKAGENVEIYNAVGQKLIQTKTVEGLNSIQVSSKGVMLVRVDNRIAKVIL